LENENGDLCPSEDALQKPDALDEVNSMFLYSSDVFEHIITRTYVNIGLGFIPKLEQYNYGFLCRTL